MQKVMGRLVERVGQVVVVVSTKLSNHFSISPGFENTQLWGEQRERHSEEKLRVQCHAVTAVLIPQKRYSAMPSPNVEQKNFWFVLEERNRNKPVLTRRAKKQLPTACADPGISPHSSTAPPVQ